tara:strand:- start:404 stop:1468 length:1065 start_codon:yes stop_codon:yes gene_type:complete
MFEQSELQQALIKGRREDPSFINIARIVKNSRKRIERRVTSTDRRVGGDHILVRILGALQLSINMDYDSVEWHCRRALTRVANSVGATCENNFGKAFQGTFIPKQDELIAIVAESVNPNKRWRKYSPARYVYHNHTNVDWEFATEGKGLAFIEINLVELAWQYVQSLRHYSTRPIEERPNVFIWLYRHVVYNMLPSYFNLSVFNRHYAKALGREIEPDYPNRIYPVPNIWDALDKHVDKVHGFLRDGNPLPAVSLNHVPLPFVDAKLSYFTSVGLITHPGMKAQTWQLRWFYQVANLHFVRFALAYRNDTTLAFLPRLKRELRAFKQLRIVSKMPSHLQVHINRELIKPIENEL